MLIGAFFISSLMTRYGRDCMSKVFITGIKGNNIINVSPINISFDSDEMKHLVLTGRNGSGKTSLLRELSSYLYAIFSQTDISKKNVRVQLNITKEELSQRAGLGEVLMFAFPALRRFAPRSTSNAQKAEDRHPIALETMEIPMEYNGILQFMVNLDFAQHQAEKNGDNVKAEAISRWMQTLENSLKEIFHCAELSLKQSEDGFSFWITMPNKVPISFSSFSDGYSAFLDIMLSIMESMRYLTYYNFELPGIVIIDEIETHLHVELQKEILPFLTKMFPNVQFIVSTHSPFVVSSVANAVVYDMETGKTEENMTMYSYESIIEKYFGVDMYSAYVKSIMKEYRELIGLEVTGVDREARLDAIELYLDSKLVEEDSSEVALSFVEAKLMRRACGHGKVGKE